MFYVLSLETRNILHVHMSNENYECNSLIYLLQNGKAHFWPKSLKIKIPVFKSEDIFLKSSDY